MSRRRRLQASVFVLRSRPDIEHLNRVDAFADGDPGQAAIEAALVEITGNAGGRALMRSAGFDTPGHPTAATIPGVPGSGRYHGWAQTPFYMDGETPSDSAIAAGRILVRHLRAAGLRVRVIGHKAPDGTDPQEALRCTP